MEPVIAWQNISEWFTMRNALLGAFWLGVCAVAVGLLLLLRTRVGRAHPLNKYLVFSLIAHLLLIAYAMTVKIVMPSPPGRSEEIVWFSLDVDAEGEQPTVAAQSPHPEFPEASSSAPPQPTLEERPPGVEPSPPPLEDPAGEPNAESPIDSTAEELFATEAVSVEMPEAEEPVGEVVETPVPHFETVGPPIETAAVAESARGESPAPNAVSEPESDEPGYEIISIPVAPIEPRRRSVTGLAASGGAGQEAPAAGEHSSGLLRNVSRPAELPAAYRLRVDPDRLELARRYGADEATERAVGAALGWLARAQSADGSWEPVRYGGGREEFVLDEDRNRAGSRAETGITGLALLAFLGAGHTHRDGEYREVVQRGLQFLVGRQADDGNLGGLAQTYEFMYCHGMATLALGEAYGMTGDAALRPVVRRAVAFTVQAQDRRSGGWRYRPRDPGDTSQMGWQLMALRSARLAGFGVPSSSEILARRFLESVSGGRTGSLSAYRPGEPVSPAMTAEAWVCRQTIGDTLSSQALHEATAFLLQHRPGVEKDNFYFWYYGTLALFYTQGPDWDRWNRALKSRLLELQIEDGPDAGSWPSDTVWGCYGGTIYTTSLATLCLEVYYRYLPMYVASPSADARWR